MKKPVFLSKSAAQTKRIAGQIIENKVIKKSAKGARILALAGELGSGKTTFIQGLAKALGIKGRVTSPSFIIMRRWQLNNCLIDQLNNFYHIDCYRLNKPKELIDLDFKEIINNSKNLIVIEWADKVKLLIPKEAVWVKFEWVGENKRRISF